MPPIRNSPSASKSVTDGTFDQHEVCEGRASPELQAELLEAMAQIDRGEYFEMTFEQLDHAATTGEWPWPEDESPV